MSSLSGHNLSCRRGDTLVFSDLNFDLKAGQILALRGPNGSGKTTLLRMIAGLLSPNNGQLEWTGELPLTDSVHWVGPANPLKPDLTVRENLKFWRALHSSDDIVDSVLATKKLAHLGDSYVRHLSEGQKRRVNLCRLLITPRPVWLLDEPDTGLDQASADLFRDLVRAHTSQGGMVVLATHNPDVWGSSITTALEFNA